MQDSTKPVIASQRTLATPVDVPLILSITDLLAPDATVLAENESLQLEPLAGTLQVNSGVSGLFTIPVWAVDIGNDWRSNIFFAQVTVRADNIAPNVDLAPAELETGITVTFTEGDEPLQLFAVNRIVLSDQDDTELRAGNR